MEVIWGSAAPSSVNSSPEWHLSPTSRSLEAATAYCPGTHYGRFRRQSFCFFRASGLFLNFRYLTKISHPLSGMFGMDTRSSYAGHYGGFIAAAGFRKIKDNADLKLQASRHFDWATHTYEETLGWKTPFISVFGTRHHAENRGRKCEGTVKMYEIDLTKLSSQTVIFDAVKLCNLLRINHRWAKDEFCF